MVYKYSGFYEVVPSDGALSTGLSQYVFYECFTTQALYKCLIVSTKQGSKYLWLSSISSLTFCN